MPKYKILEYCSVIDALRWLAFDIEPVSKENEDVLVSRGKRKPLNLSSLIVASSLELGRIKYGSGNESHLKIPPTEDEIKLRKSIPDLIDLLKNYQVEISAAMIFKERMRPLKFKLCKKDIFIDTSNPENYEIGYSKLIQNDHCKLIRTKSFCYTKINFFQLRKATQKRLEEESANIELTDCQTRKKAVKEFIKTLPSMSIPAAVKKIQNHFYKCNEDRGWNYKTLANQLKQIKNSDGSQKFPNAPQGNYRKNKQENSSK